MSSHILHCGDCLEGMRGLADKSVAHVITDPPYSEHVHSKSMRGLTVTHKGGATDEIAERRELGFLHISPAVMRSSAEHFARIARRWILVFCDVESSHLWREALEEFGAEYTRTMAWVKVGGAPQFTGDRPAVGFEAIVVAHARGMRKRWNGGGRPGLYMYPTAIDRDRSGLDARIHTTQKPLALMEALTSDFTDPDETVCDPYAGSATTLAAAVRLGRNSVGWELDPTIHADATARLDTIAPWWRSPSRKRFSGHRPPKPRQTRLLP